MISGPGPSMNASGRVQNDRRLTAADSSVEELTGVRRVAVVGAGLIGARWAAQFLAGGLDVVATDSAPGAEQRMLADIAAAWPALLRLGRTDVPRPPAVTFTAHLREAVAQADWVQESVPDDTRLKLEVMRRIDEVTKPRTIIASSTSGILPTLLQSVCVHPARVLVGHPFNPVHILPLVEVVPGKETAQCTVDRAMAFYSALGKRPLHVRTEAPGFIANRLQEALCREFFHLVRDGICTTAELDEAMVYGPGLRLALFGPAFVYRLGGGRNGLVATLRQFNPTAIEDWSHNAYPPLTDELVKALDAQTAAQAEGRSVEEWEALRDEFLVRLIQLREHMLREDE